MTPTLDLASCLAAINPGIMARLRSQALNIARANGVANIANAMWNAALDPAVSLSYNGL